MIICPHCNLEKDISYFYLYPNGKPHKKCKECRSSSAKEYYINNKEKILEQTNQYKLEHKEEIKIQGKEYRENNKEEIKEKNTEYYENNKEKITARDKEYRENNKEKIKEHKKEYYETNKEEIKARDKEYRENNKARKKEYYENNKEKIKAQKKEYETERRKTDPSFKLRKNISRQIHLALKAQGSSKAGQSVLDHLPYSIEELKAHLEAQFESWMNWDNWGIYDPETFDDHPTWQLDHRIPQSKLPFTSMNEDNFQRCWALNNLRPLSAKQNVLEGNRRNIDEKIIK